MEYVSAKEMAQKWGIHIRVVQTYCMQGRVLNAKKFGNLWMIPTDAKKPVDPRKARKQQPAPPFYTLPLHCPLLTMTALYRNPGSGDAVAASLTEDGEATLLFSAQLAYLRGDISGAAALTKQLSVAENRPDVCIGAAFLQSLCALYQGDATQWRSARKSVEAIHCPDENQAAQRDFWLGNLDLELYDISGFPKWFCEGDFAVLPGDCYPMARYAYMKYHMLRTMKSDAALIAKPFLSQSRLEGALVSEIYCRLMLAVGYHEQGDAPKAAEQIDAALALALPDRLYAPFAEYRDNLETLLDSRLAITDKEAARAVKRLNLQLSAGWTRLKRELHGVHNNTELTPQEHYAAKLAAKGLTNAQIAGRMQVSVNSVRRYISEALGKTGAVNRKELANFLAMDEKNL